MTTLLKEDKDVFPKRHRQPFKVLLPQEVQVVLIVNGTVCIALLLLLKMLHKKQHRKGPRGRTDIKSFRVYEVSPQKAR